MPKTSRHGVIKDWCMNKRTLVQSVICVIRVSSASTGLEANIWPPHSKDLNTYYSEAIKPATHGMYNCKALRAVGKSLTFQKIQKTALCTDRSCSALFPQVAL